MLYLFALAAAALLSSGQALWKTAALKYPPLIEKGASIPKAAFSVIFSLQFLSGATLYILATLIYLWLFSKYPYYQVQLIFVAFTLIFSVGISYFLFKENWSIVNFLGVLFLILGVYLITKKS